MSKRSSPSPSGDDLEIVSWTGRTSPVTGERPPRQFTIGDRSASPMFASIADAQKAKREIRLDPYRKSPIPDMMKGHKKVPAMKDIMPDLKKMKKDGTWGGKRRSRAARRVRGTRRRHRTKNVKSRRVKKTRKTRSGRRTRRRSTRTGRK